MFLLTLFPNTQRGCSLRDAINKMRCRYISVGIKGRCVCSPVQGRAAGTSVCVMACQQQFKRAAPAVQSMLPSLPPSSPMTCRTGRWRPGFHKNTARSLFCMYAGDSSHGIMENAHRPQPARPPEGIRRRGASTPSP